MGYYIRVTGLYPLLWIQDTRHDKVAALCLLNMFQKDLVIIKENPTKAIDTSKTKKHERCIIVISRLEASTMD